MHVSCSAGTFRQTRFDLYLSIEEILAWLPELHQKAKDSAVKEAATAGS